MKRSGQYKISGSGSKGSPDSDIAVPGQFRINPADLPPNDSPVSEFPHMNSLVVTINKMSDSRPPNKNCENISGPRGTVNRVEQRVKSFLQRGESKLKLHENHILPPLTQSTADDVWQYGHVVTLPRHPRHSLALSSSALNHLSALETASCLSASSGYSSSSSSSYGSFKSSASSNCSTLPKRKTISEISIKPSPSRSSIFVDNPIYDITPGTDSHTQPQASIFIHSKNDNDPKYPKNKLYRHRSASVPRCDPLFDDIIDINQQPFKRQSNHRGSAPSHEFLYGDRSNSNHVNYECDNSVSTQVYSNLENEPIYDTIPGGDLHSPRKSVKQEQSSGHLTSDSCTLGENCCLDESALDFIDSCPLTSICSSVDMIKEEDQVAKECREYFEKRLKNSETLKKRWSMCSSDSGADSGDSEMSSLCYASSKSTSSASCTAASQSSSTLILSSSESQEKSPTARSQLDCKMKFLRKEIASLMKQDNQLFQQLLNLHESISALKTNPAPDPHSHTPPSPASFGSLTEEEEEEEEEEDEDEELEEDEDEKCNDMKDMPAKHGLKTDAEEDNSDVDEGHETDHSLTHSVSPTSTRSSKSSRDFPLSSNSCHESTVPSKSSGDATCSKDFQYSTSDALSPDCRPLPSRGRAVEPFQRDVSITVSSSSFSGAPGNIAFMRSRKSYAPNARNRRRSSSAHLVVRHESDHAMGHNVVHGVADSLLGHTTESLCRADASSCFRVEKEDQDGVAHAPSCLREPGPTQQSCSPSVGTCDLPGNQLSSQFLNKNTQNRGKGQSALSSTDRSSDYKSEQQQLPEVMIRRPRSSSAILTAAMYPSIPLSRPLNNAVFRETLIM